MDAAQYASLMDQVEADMEFHRTLCRLTGNETLLHSWIARNSVKLVRFWFPHHPRGTPRPSPQCRSE